MRNLREYPVTKEELLKYIDREKAETIVRTSGLMGNMDALYLECLHEIVKEVCTDEMIKATSNIVIGIK